MHNGQLRLSDHVPPFGTSCTSIKSICIVTAAKQTLDRTKLKKPKFDNKSAIPRLLHVPRKL